MRPRRSGQSMIEISLAVAAITTLFWGSIKIWGWVDSSVVHREQQYQATRLAAGQPATLGTINPYPGEPLNIYGNLSAPANRTTVPAAPDCPAAAALVQQANDLLAKVQQDMDDVTAKQAEALPYQTELARLGALYKDPHWQPSQPQPRQPTNDSCQRADTIGNYDDVVNNCGMCSGNNWRSRLGRNWQWWCDFTGGGDNDEDTCRAMTDNLMSLNDHLKPIENKIEALSNEITALRGQAVDLIHQAWGVCGGYQSPP